MALEFQFKSPDGKVVRLYDLPIEDVQDIASKAGLESWYDMLQGPARFGHASTALYRYCCKQVDVEPVEPVTVQTIIDAFELVPDDLPEQFEDGIPVPEADAQTTD
jgi:hypothetical protein